MYTAAGSRLVKFCSHYKIITRSADVGTFFGTTKKILTVIPIEIFERGQNVRRLSEKEKSQGFWNRLFRKYFLAYNQRLLFECIWRSNELWIHSFLDNFIGKPWVEYTAYMKRTELYITVFYKFKPKYCEKLNPVTDICSRFYWQLIKGSDLHIRFKPIANDLYRLIFLRS